MSPKVEDYLSCNIQTNNGILRREDTTMQARSNRRKISTTVAPETDTFLKSLIRRGKASSLAEAVDRAVAVARRAESRHQLEAATAAYYASLSGKALEEEQKLELAAGSASSLVDFDGE
jgi:hypothetical protein